MSGTRDDPPSLPASILVIGGVVAVIAYLCLHPFEFRLPPGGLQLSAIEFRRTSIADMASNALLYVPLGAALSWALSRRIGVAGGVACSVALGLVLSTCLEVLQQSVAGRYCNATDIAINTTGALLGAPLGALLHWPVTLRSRLAVLYLVSVAAWGFARWIPFKPSIHWREWRVELQALWAAPWPLDRMAWFAGASLAVYGALVGAGLPRRRAVVAWALLAMGVALGRLPIEGIGADPAEMAGFVIAASVLAIAWLQPGREALLLALATTAFFLVDALRPWQFASAPRAFDWAPFATVLRLGDRVAALRSLAEQVFWALALVLVWSRAGLVPAKAVGIALLMAVTTEAAQRWLPGRTPDPMLPLLVLTAGLALQFARRPLTR